VIKMDLSQIGRQFGLDDAQTRAAFEALAPVVAAGVRKSAQTPSGLQDVLKRVVAGGYGDTLGNPEAVAFERAKPRGDDVLGQIFGSPDVSRGVAQQLSMSSGIGAVILKKLLPIVASIVMGQVAKRMGGAGSAPAGGAGGGFGDILKDILGGGAGGGGQGGGMSLPGGGSSGGGLGVPSLPDAKLGQGGRSINMPQTPQADPGNPDDYQMSPQRNTTGRNPLEDMLNDIINNGGQNGRVVVKQIPPGQMGDILRDIFGGQLPSGQQAPTGEGVERGRRAIEDVTGGGTPRGTAAEDLLNSVERSLRRG
jgi:hypothetical protein